jgi:hypothetical protein
MPAWSCVLRVRVLQGLAVLFLMTLTACGDAPTQPGPIQRPAPQPTPNQAPVVESITVSTQRAEADTDVTVTATVRDAETAIDQLRFDWSADAGAFSGTGASVRWRLPRGASTPGDHTLRLTVVETYGTAQHAIAASSPAIRVHDSPTELGDMAMRFLGLFANSSVPADEAVREFSDSCAGKQVERRDVQNNRRDFEVLSSRLTLMSARVSVPWAQGAIAVSCEFSSRRKNCPSGAPSSCRVGTIDNVKGTCRLTAVYEQQRWFLCTSQFDAGLLPMPHGFFGTDR